MSNEINIAYSAVFQSNIVATYDAKENAIKPLRLWIERHLDGVGFHPHVIALYKVMKTPPRKLIIPSICCELVNTRRVILIQFYIVIIILNCWILLQIIQLFSLM